MITINLKGDDGTLHIAGELPNSLLSDLHLIQRNGRIYYFNGFNSEGLQFIECKQPYILVEF